MELKLCKICKKKKAIRDFRLHGITFTDTCEECWKKQHTKQPEIITRPSFIEEWIAHREALIKDKERRETYNHHRH